ncbi:glutaredoxin family protein [Luteimonas mephitis]|uniref:glutaredoxin family protein n=1 Tax=Luteimonas mephitis TaxID=83615 RepID=UPI000424D2EC|nr:glutaredoxin family protein [Luteimonas mephitis]
MNPSTTNAAPGLQLIQRDDCPLCDQALAVLAAARVPEFDTVWIDDVDALETAYGARVPVLRDTVGGAELDWPFDAERVRAWWLQVMQRRLAR